ncbi:MAG: intradiol ring-cleavage dioxygenase [Cypionkella sp.]|uniref:intradiol ring-cleavage dioxygenase n=1 Tax=Cypionkella sp. TaxID=2811411 RepID=UPI002AB87B0C|nr:intradiol ring-cleavage dioxygenase [Cypionkella sp.]MDZ4309718.1 intradiol ring-cleavage dioxygenase [Cypionkella sp.]
MRPLSTLDRRTVLKAMSLAPLAVLPSGVAARAESAGLISTDVCLLQKEVTEGPFYLDPQLLRADITEGRPGLPMQLRLQVVTADCTPVVGARVDVWHCDAQGVYSGVRNLGGGADTEGQSFLRGAQMTDSTGVATFQTIFPGWYPGRTTHVHYKVFLDDKTVLTSQIFFDEAVNQAIYADDESYARSNARDMMNAQDRIAAQAGEWAYAQVKMTEPDGAMEAALVVGISPDGDTSGLFDWLWKRA